MALRPRAPLLALNDPELEWKRFERFSLDLTRALPDVIDAHLYGDRGEAQHGIDIHADLIGGRVRTIQCRRVQRFTKASARAVIAETAYVGDEHCVWCTCPMSGPARDVIAQSPRWSGWDIEQLSSALRGLPRETARWIVEDHLGSAARKALLGPEAELCVAPAARWFARQDADGARLPTNHPLIGRDPELSELETAVADLDARVVILPGRSGVGKTRLLRALSDAASAGRALVLRDGVEVTATLPDELPQEPFVLLIDDADRRPDLPGALATVLSRGTKNTIVLTTRPQRVPELRAAIASGGVAGHAVRELPRVESLSVDAATELAAMMLGESGPAAERLGRATRDIPALCVLGARLLIDDELHPARLAGQADTRIEILSRFRDELVGDVAESVDRKVMRRVLQVIAAAQPLDVANDELISWAAAWATCDVREVEEAVGALGDAGLLAGGVGRRRIVPDLLADFVLQEACIMGGRPTSFAKRIAADAPAQARSAVLANLAEAEWRLTAEGLPSILSEVLADLRRAIARADAWQRAERLAELTDASTYLAPWVLELCRDVLDHPDRPSQAGPGGRFEDDYALAAMVPLLSNAALDLRATAGAVGILWEIGRDARQRAALGEREPLEVAASFAGYQLPLRYAEVLLDVVKTLLADPAEAEGHAALPLAMLKKMVEREGTRSSWKGHTLTITPFLVSAATAPLRSRLRQLLVDSCLRGGDRIRPAAAGLLGDMLRQPHGRFGHRVPEAGLSQWRDEQRALLDDADAIMGATSDPLVMVALRDDLTWHRNHSAIRGIRTHARRVLSGHPATSDEILVRLLGVGDFGLDDRDLGARRQRRAGRLIAGESPTTPHLLDRVDAALEHMRRGDPGTYPDARRLLAQLGALDPDWALEAAVLLIREPHRPTAPVAGVLLSEALASVPEQARPALHVAATAADPLLRKMAADHVVSLRWSSDPDAPERAMAVTMAADEDREVVNRAAITAHRLTDTDPRLAREIVLAIGSFADPEVAKSVGMALSHDLGLTAADEDRLLDRFLPCPQIDFWHDRFLVDVASRRPLRVVAYLLARLGLGADPSVYDALPYDGLSTDPLADTPAGRAPALRAITAAAPQYSESVGSLDVAQMFWSFAGDSDDAFAVLGDGLTGEPASIREAAADILSHAARTAVLSRPEWVAAQLDHAEPGFLDDLCGALSAALTMGLKQGTPGEPFPEDIELRDRASEHQAASRPGGRAASFWAAMVRSADRAIAAALEDVLADDG